MSPPITILGAGLAGLTLARCLKHKSIPFTILEKATSAAHYNYVITLYPWSYKPLLRVLEIDEIAFREKVGIGALRDGNGEGCNSIIDADGVRCHRGRLEGLLREGLDVRWSHEIADVDIPSSGKNARTMILHFRNQKPIETAVLIGADGVHSQVRAALTPEMKPEVLPYVVFYGRRRLDQSEYQSLYAPYLSKSPMLETRHGTSMLQISLCDRKNHHIDINYIYSRPAVQNDPLHNPGRTNSQATQTPEAVYAELEALPDLQTPFKETFDAQKVRQDRVLHWLMRSLSGHDSELRALAGQGILLIGDAAHAMPILGGYGANAAIGDGVELAEYIMKNGAQDLGGFLETRMRSWEQDVDGSKQRLREMHALVEAVL